MGVCIGGKFVDRPREEQIVLEEIVEADISSVMKRCSMKSAHHNEGRNPCKMLSDAFPVRRISPSVDEVPFVQAQACGVCR